jgi:hypothetical protein
MKWLYFVIGWVVANGVIAIQSRSVVDIILVTVGIIFAWISGVIFVREDSAVRAEMVDDLAERAAEAGEKWKTLYRKSVERERVLSSALNTIHLHRPDRKLSGDIVTDAFEEFERLGGVVHEL